jgi:hypothetical protein
VSEVANIAEVANRVANEIFKWFKWEKVPYMDENFDCVKVENHKKVKGKKESHQGEMHQHPVDVVFEYFDPYLNKKILLNTDLKSYSKKSISAGKVESALVSLAKTIECAKASKEWKKKYKLNDDPFEIRGLLFIYNHDNEYDGNFLTTLAKIKSKKIPIDKGQVLHIIHPLSIRYLTTVVADLKGLCVDEGFPLDDYTFLYPELYLHKHSGNYKNYPATIELLCAPFMLIKHGPLKIEEGNKIHRSGSGGYIIYYNRSGETEYEFMYLFDLLSRFQMLSSDKTISIRVANNNPSNLIKNNYRRAIEKYVREWGGDDFKRKDLERIEMVVINVSVHQFRPGVLAWREEG